MPEVQQDVCGEVVIGRPLTAREEELYEFGKQSIAESVTVQETMLGRVCTFALALAAGMFAAAKGEAINPIMAAVAAMAFLASLFIAASGLWPIIYRLQPDVLESLDQFQSDVGKRKADTLMASGIVFIVGLVIAATGLIWKMLHTFFYPASPQN